MSLTARRRQPRGARHAQPPPDDHFFNGRFKIEIEGVTQGAFTQCSGLEARIDVVQFNDGSDLLTRKRPGRPGVSNLVLKRGVVDSTELWDWFKSAYDGKVERRPAR